MNKKRFLVVTCILWIVEIVNAQSDSIAQHSNIRREKFRLAIAPSNSMDKELKPTVLTKDKLQLMLSNRQFKTYNHARRYYHASIPLLSLAACGIVVTSFCFGMWVDSKIYPDRYKFPDKKNQPVGLGPILFSVVTLPFLISGVTLIVYSTKTIDKIAENYNGQYNSSWFQNNIQMNFGFTLNGLGLKLTF